MLTDACKLHWIAGTFPVDSSMWTSNVICAQLPVPSQSKHCCCMQMSLRQKNELVCLAMERNMIAVGSQSHISMLDPRMSKSGSLYELETTDPGQVRLLKFSPPPDVTYALQTFVPQAI